MLTTLSANTVPKVILHTHLEGSIPAQTLDRLSTRNKISLSFDPYSSEIHKSIEPGNWTSFRKIYSEICSCFINENDFHDSVYEYGVQLANQNVIYAEIHISPWKHFARGVPLEAIAKGVISAIDKLENEKGIVIRIICDLVRNKDEQGDMITDWLIELTNTHFVGLGISGGTNAIDRVHYKKYCEKIKKKGYGVTAHAGEIEGPESVIEIIDYFQVDRIGHGIRSKENNELWESLIAKQIHFELCPTANKIIGACKTDYSLINELITNGANFSINPDDELLFNTDINNEISILINEGIISSDHIAEIQKNTLENSFAGSETKSKLVNKHFDSI